MRSKVHPKYKTKYRVGNWSAYEQALVQRGDVTLWLSADATDAWRPAPSGRPGAPKKFSDCAIETALTLRLVFRLPLRQAEGFLRSVLSLMGVDLEARRGSTGAQAAVALLRGAGITDVQIVRAHGVLSDHCYLERCWYSENTPHTVAVVDATGDALGRQQTVVQHMRALPHGAVADALTTVRASPASVTVKQAFEFLVLTAARSGEVRLATWDEMDLDAGVWAIPAARMKAKRDHRVPLSGRALAILHEVQGLSDGTGFVFRSRRGKPLSAVTLPRLTRDLGIAAVPHGFRSSFRDWAAERTSTPREVVEAALAHTVQNPTEAAYARSDLFGRRRRLMDDWAAYLSGAHGQV